MSVENIMSSIRLAGLQVQEVWDTNGILIRVKIPNKNKAICSWVPIDEQAHNKFAEFLIESAIKDTI